MMTRLIRVVGFDGRAPGGLPAVTYLATFQNDDDAISAVAAAHRASTPGEVQCEIEVVEAWPLGAKLPYVLPGEVCAL